GFQPGGDRRPVPSRRACRRRRGQLLRRPGAQGLPARAGARRNEPEGTPVASAVVSPLSARALVLEKPRTLVARELPVPEHGDDDAVLRVEACGLCGTDHEQYTGHLRGVSAFVTGPDNGGVVWRCGILA